MPIMTPAVDTVLARLFLEERSAMSAWMEQTQARANACANASAQSASPPVLRFSAASGPEENAALLSQICKRVDDDGFALYAWSDTPENPRSAVSDLLTRLSLVNADQGIIRESDELSLLEDLGGTPKGRFPPYQSKAMNWHTDGYYNSIADSVRCFTLHCVEPATEGGELCLMDDTFLILALLEDDPELAALLSHPQSMTLPGNRDDVGHNRPDRSVPMIHRNNDGSLTLRFTTRTRHIQWRCAETKAAAERALELITGNPHLHVRVRLERGEGIVTRNVLHAREPFVDASGKPKRQILRGRFHTLPTTLSAQTAR